MSDDGAGIAIDRLKAVAVRRGIVTDEEADRLDDNAAQRLVFRSEVSTGSTVTRTSGRGLGLAIVRENAQRLGGKVRVRSSAGVGTTFAISLPAMRASFRGILCRVAGHSLLMPSNQVDRVARIAQDRIQTVEGQDAISTGTGTIALVRLADVLALAPPPQGGNTDAYVQVLVVSANEQTLGFVVDAVIDEQEGLVKPLRKPLQRVPNIASIAVLGSGALVPILNVNDLFRSARQLARNPVRAAPAVDTQASMVTRSILVAEDSITSRMLLKTILESAGYQVTTASDGMEAFNMLRSEPFDLLVSDVEMPRLGGFDLTARVRADPRLATLPVILVTALATDADRERGLDAGANAYIVKGNFDQDVLVDAVRRLV